jgi:aromatic-L-amino-acid decarboxylase
MTEGHDRQLRRAERFQVLIGADLVVQQSRLADALQADGRVWIASALIDGDVWLRPCFVNFRTTEEDVLALIDVTLELGSRLA